MKRMIKTKLGAALMILLILTLLAGCGKGGNSSSGGSSESTVDTYNEKLNIYCFDAGKADSFLLYTENSAVLIDCGEKGFGKEILAKLDELGITKLDHLIITHFDKDHVGGAAKVINNFPVENLIASDCPKDSEEYEKYQKAITNAGLDENILRTSLSFTLDGVTYTIDPPAKTNYNSDDSNNSSLIVSVRNGENSFLFTGDAQDERIKEFVSGNKENYDVLKCPYHGNYQDSLSALLGSAQPSYVIITSSDDEPEDQKTLDLIASAGAQSYFTRKGSVLITSDGKNISIRQ